MEQTPPVNPSSQDAMTAKSYHTTISSHRVTTRVEDAIAITDTYRYPRQSIPPEPTGAAVALTFLSSVQGNRRLECEGCAKMRLEAYEGSECFI